MKTKPGANQAEKVSDLRKAYPALATPAMRRLADRIDPSYKN